MNKMLKFLPLVLLPIAIILLGNSTGSIGGKTGSVGDSGINCTQCHTGQPQNATSWITTNIPQSGYVPGQTYSITVSGTHTGVVKFGFELTAENASGTKVGTFAITNATQTKLTNGNKAVTHTSAGTTPTAGSKTWSANWTAPNPAVGPVVFNAALNAANGNGNNQGDVIYITSATVQPVVLVSVTFQVDMSLQTVSPNGVHIAGNFQNPPWVPSATLMTHQGNNIYAVTLDIAAGFAAQFKYINGNAWGMDESVPGTCATGGNRFFTVPAEPLMLPLVCFGSCNSCSANVNVTFRVDMSEQTVSPLGVHVAGNFQGWNPGATLMTDQGANIYAVTLSLPAGNYYEYKFVNGNTWPVAEIVPAGCAVGGNRYFTVPDAAVTLPLVCFGSCVACVVPTVDITFRVDMAYQTVSPNGVHIAGSFQGWDPASTPMTLVSGSIYAAIVSLEVGNSYEYKFVNGNAWGSEELVPVECSVGLNRVLIVPDVNTTLDPICFAMCTVCPAPAQVDITFQVDMSNEVVSPDGVHLVGSFQGWNYTTNPMTLLGDGIYQATVNLTEFDHHTYKFVNGNVRTKAETVPLTCAESTLFNGNARFFDVPGINTTLDLVCFGKCETCIPPPTADVTFQVDMTGQIVSPNGVHLVGSMQGWDPATTIMIDQGNGIYAVTLNLLVGETHEYKFVNGNTFAGLEAVPAECAQNLNRFLTVPAENTTLDVVCFGSCGTCSPPVLVTFSVDMAEQTVSPNGVHVAGNFQGWDPGTCLMTLSHDAVYTFTTTLISGFTYEYKFINGTIWDESETVPAGCASNSNRYIIAPADPVVLDAVCFGSCTICVPPTAEVTFQVDMTNEPPSPDGVFLVGTFQGWAIGTNPMTLSENNIYSCTVTLPIGSYQEYKFVNGLIWDGAEGVPGECGLNGNRYLTVPETPTTLPSVCFAGCGNCPLLAWVKFSVDMTNETVSPDGVHIVGDFESWDPGAIALQDDGTGIYSVGILMVAGSYQTFKYLNGNTFDGSEIVPYECGVEDGFGGFKRHLTVPDIDTDLDVVCFSKCTPCSPPVVDVTFQVDMTNEPPSPNGVYLVGTFQGWNIGANPMTLSEGNIYSCTVPLAIGSYQEYKFVNGLELPGYEVVPAECSQNGNRFLTVPETATTLPSVCFAGCGNCPQLAWVKFSVDMTNETVSPDGVHIVGDFESWDPAAIALSDDGNGIYSVTVLMVAGSYQTYKYLNGNTFEGSEIVPAECGVDDGFGGFKRFLNVPLTETELDVVCFSMCSTCTLQHSIALKAGWNSLSSYVMPSETDIATLLSDIYPELIIIQSLTEVYYPAENLNTIGTWDSQSAYTIKLSQDVTLTIAGTPENNKTLQLSAGWNMIPVIGNEPVDSETLFAPVTTDLIVVKGIASTEVFWPEYSINSLGNLLPGKAYFVKMLNPGTITFP
jgi:1,4-alpha-glucan branching enzyme